MNRLFNSEKQSFKAQRRDLIRKVQAGCKVSELVSPFRNYYEDFCRLRNLNPCGPYYEVWSQMQETIIISLECCDTWDLFQNSVDMGLFVISIYGAAISALDNYADGFRQEFRNKAVRAAL